MSKEKYYLINPDSSKKYISQDEIHKFDPKLSKLMTHVFDCYGSRVPYPFTIFDGIYRECLDNPSQIDHVYGKTPTIKYINLQSIDDSWSLEDYCDKFSASVACETEYAAVMLSSGWDSTSILAELCRTMDSSKVKAFTLKINLGEDEPVNSFEINKAKSFCDYYGVDLTLVESKHFHHDYVDIIRKCSEKGLFALTATSHEFLWEAIRDSELNPENTTVYAGEYSDGAHNFGYAQHFSAVYPDKGFRQYADKIKSYFLSPLFLRRLISENELRNDFLVTNFGNSDLLKNYYGWNELDVLKDMLGNIFFLDARGPFSASNQLNHLNSDTIKTFSDVYLSTLDVDLDYWYSCVLSMYQNFHWSGSTVRGINELNDSNYTVNLPFGNNMLIKSLEAMPTNFGRGLEPLPTKYPLKYYCQTRLDKYPFYLQDGPHAYIYDVDQSRSLLNTAYENTQLGELIRSYWNDDSFSVRSNYLSVTLQAEVSKSLDILNKNRNETYINLAATALMVDMYLEKVFG